VASAGSEDQSIHGPGLTRNGHKRAKATYRCLEAVLLFALVRGGRTRRFPIAKAEKADF
jgi:hypothetical protein